MFSEKRKTWLTIVAGIVISLIIAAAIAAILLPRLLDLENYRPQIISMARTALQRPVAYQSAEFTWHPYPTIVCRGITVREKSSPSDFLTIDRLSLNLALFPLLNREVRLREVVVDRSVLMLERDRQGALNIDDLFRGSKVFGIFKRTLNLPGELVAEPGKVILGQ